MKRLCLAFLLLTGCATYQEHRMIKGYKDGVRDYSKLKGGTLSNYKSGYVAGVSLKSLSDILKDR